MDEVLGHLAVAARAQGEREQLTLVGVVDRGDELGGPRGRLHDGAGSRLEVIQHDEGQDVIHAACDAVTAWMLRCPWASGPSR